MSPVQSANNRIILLTKLNVLLPFVMHLQNLDRLRHDQDFLTRSDTISISQICDGKWWAEGGFSMCEIGKFGQDQTWSGGMVDGGRPPRSLSEHAHRVVARTSSNTKRQIVCSLCHASSSFFYASSTHFCTYPICVGVARGVVSAGSNRRRCGRERSSLFWHQEEQVRSQEEWSLPAARRVGAAARGMVSAIQVHVWHSI